ncbi:MAG: AAA family ATPase [Rhodococcus sp. (in: high G+C Gram-positive bacteria)]|uniref:AAA family ATPase n=1 Tax=Rhodococcus sp. TaxID=1831 RepID=UPI003BAF0C55
MDESQIVDRHLQALTALAAGNTSAARDHFVYALRKGTRECDIFRGLAACEPGRVASDENVQAIYLTRSTFGNLTYKAFVKDCRAVKEQIPARADVEHLPQCQYRTGFFGVDIPILFLGNVHAAAAAAYINVRQFDKALAVLDEAPTDLPSVKLMTAALYYRTERWPDVISAAAPLQTAAMINEHGAVTIGDDGRPAPNVLYQELSYLLSGTALAHLGSTSSAESSLTVLLNSRFNQISAEAHRVLGLLARAAGDEQQAQKLFGIGVALSKSDDLVRAQTTRNEILRLTNAEMISRRDSYWDVTTEPSLAAEQLSEQDDERTQLLARATAELERQIGMTNVKKQIAQLRQSVRVTEELKKRGLPTPGRSNHLMFMGPPGTGKTTIARVVADFYAGTGVCRIPKIIEVKRADLVGQHWGESGPKTKAVIASALGGVLFIDEAYDLVQATENGQTDPLGQEAVNVLLTEMENHRHDLVVIIAGYEEDLRRFLATNDGLVGRFTTTIRFETYSPEELADIAEVIAEGKNWILTDDAKKAVSDVARRMVRVIDENRKTMIDTAGNGRFVRNIIEKAEGYRSSRFESLDLSVMSDDELRTLTENDVRSAAEELYEDRAR